MYLILIILLCLFITLFFFVLKFSNGLKNTWPAVNCEDVLSDSNQDWDMVKKFSLVEYHYIEKYNVRADEMSTFNIQCYCDKLVEEKGRAYAKKAEYKYIF